MITTSVESQKTIVIYPNIWERSFSVCDVDARLQEACGLARAINLNVVHREVLPIRRVRPATLFGEGQIDLIQSYIAETSATLLIIDSSLGPVQQRNLEKKLNCKVIDRTALILEIFGTRARTAEGRMQVELAALTYQKSRLVRTWTHLDRQGGGMGLMGGPGETQIELDRRIISDRIMKIKRELEDVKRTRTLHRQSRKRVPYPIVALVGYTNAGKSTLFNQITKAQVFAKDLLFATLDPTMRLVKLPSGKQIILSDTVGFISELPTPLIAAFRATLEEVLEADLILHVRDVAHDQTDQQRQDVLKILNELGLQAPFLTTHLMEVLNKIDLLKTDQKPVEDMQDSLLKDQSDEDQENVYTSHALSALTGEGVPTLLSSVEEKLEENHQQIDVTLESDQGAMLAWFYQHGHVIERQDENDKIYLKIKLSPSNWMRYQKMSGLSKENEEDIYYG